MKKEDNKIIENVDEGRIEVKFPISLQKFYENMGQYISINGYGLSSPSIAKCLKMYMLKDSYNLIYQRTKLNNLKTRLIWIQTPIEDYSNKRKFIKMWIEECVKAHNLKGDFSINDFEQKMREGKIWVKN
ncbi:hypothetical protein [Mycoplasma procyoni]|uniref:hypothetical protein n=1 Tax=Mycoplasma procyoni TaxID=568784 RepID=UPI00197B170C|nr:hypothetical protein [Mycoplasma procyoni]MBN3534735.1 hypothetical protein [Mycoplasma procyoni]